MLETFREWLIRTLKVPPEPSPPSGAGEIRIFRAAPNYYRYRFILWLLAQSGALIGLVAGFFALSFAIERVTVGWAVFLFRFGEVVAWSVFIVQLFFSYTLLRLDFELRWYILSDRALRIREGIISLREKTMTFANIQQISIRQNPLQRLLGIADVQVRTAGGGAGTDESDGSFGESAHEAWFRGVDDAEAIRDAIHDRVRIHRDAGLGDPDELSLSIVDVDDSGGVLEAAHELRREVRALAQVLTPNRLMDR